MEGNPSSIGLKKLRVKIKHVSTVLFVISMSLTITLYVQFGHSFVDFCWEYFWLLIFDLAFFIQSWPQLIGTTIQYSLGGGKK